MKFLKSFSTHSTYLLINALIFFLGYIFILKSNTPNISVSQNAILISIGTSLIASGVIALLDLWKEILKNKVLDKINNVLVKGGIDSIYEKRDLDKYDELMKSLKDKLEITGYTLNAFFESYSDLLVEKVKNNPALSVRVILVVPSSEFARHRAELEGRNYEAYQNSVDRVVKTFQDFRNIEIRQISTPLTTMIFRIDDIMFIGPHFYKKTSKSTITVELKKKGWVFEEYEREFERLWHDAQ